MATVDRKNNDSEEHSLSSFDKRKVQSVTFGARQLNKKKYRVASRTSYPVKAPTGNVSDKNETKPYTEDVKNTSTSRQSDIHKAAVYSSSQKSRTDTHYYEHRNESSEPQSAIAERQTISPEMAERMKRAAFIQQMNKEGIAQNISSAAYMEPDVSTKSESHVESSVPLADHKQETAKNDEKPVKSAIEDYKSGITPEMAQRMKRAAFLAQQNKEAISVNTATIIPTDDFRDTEKVEEKPAPVSEKTDEQEEQSFDSRFTGNSEHAEFNRYDNARHDYAVNQAYGKYQTGQRHKQQDRENARHRDMLDEISSAATITGQLGRGEVGKVAMDIAVKSAFSENGLRDAAQTVGNAVNSSSSVSSAVPDVATTLAAVEAKKMVAKLMKGESSEKDRKFVEEHKAAGKTKYVDSNKEGFKVEHRLSDDDSITEDMSREERRNFLHNKRVAEKQKRFYTERQKIEIQNKRKEMFLDFNRDNPDLVSNTAKKSGKRYLKKKASAALIGGGAIASILPVIIILVIFAVVAAFFGWLAPFSYTLAGEEGEEDERTYEANSNAEVIDGYTKMIKNYMDVTQAYYYLNYGDWYGGTYDYPSPDVDFSDFYREYCDSIIASVEASYAPYFALATEQWYIDALNNAMRNAKANALANSLTRARAEYDILLASLDDNMTAITQRQYYETTIDYAPDGHADSAEFTGQPIVGTNFFGNLEINSDLTAEELLAYIALYKSMQIIAPEDPDADVILNITPTDIMHFFEDTQYFAITTSVTHDNQCDSQNCRRRAASEDSYDWVYYCNGDHDHLYGEIGNCLSEDELREKVMELTNADSNGVNEEAFKKLITEYIKVIKNELGIDESEFHEFGAADNTTALELYDKLVADGEIPNNYWTVDTPIGEDEEDDEAD